MTRFEFCLVLFTMCLIVTSCSVGSGQNDSLNHVNTSSSAIMESSLSNQNNESLSYSGKMTEANKTNLSTSFTTSQAVASSSVPGWPASCVYSHNNCGAWSSNLHSSPGNTEWIAYWWTEGVQNTNYIKLLPRYMNNTAWGFPVSFTIQYSQGSTWISIASYTNYPTPFRGDYIVIPLPSTVATNGIRIVATTLGTDFTGDFMFQLAEAYAGYDSRFNQFTWVNNNSSALPYGNQVDGVIANAFNPNKLANWNYDERGVVIHPLPGNFRTIYAPQAVLQSGWNWNIYFGGDDGYLTSVGPHGNPHDSIYLTTTADNFSSFGQHVKLIDHGQFIQTNNESILKLANNSWFMVYTADPNAGPGNPLCYPANPGYGACNKPAYATSPDGTSWTPNSGNSAYLLNMSGYTNWESADVNGGNTIFIDNNGIWHLYFIDLKAIGTVFHATSSDGINYTYLGSAVNSTLQMTLGSIKPFSYDGSTYYFSIYTSNNGEYVWNTVSTNLNSLGSPTQLFSNEGANDYYIVSAGLVQDGTRILGVLYGASPQSNPTLTQNRIYASWLQKKVIFQNSYVRWGDTERAYSPNNVRLYNASGDNIETGKFYVYDTDGTTLLYTSPKVTMRIGDVWNYTGQ